jgi:hypothetical protein
VRLALTADGRDKQRRIGRGHAGHVARAVTAELSRDELRQLAEICWKLAQRPGGAATPTDDKEAEHL